MSWKLIDKFGQEVKNGDELVTFRGENVVVTGIYDPGTSQGGRGGKVGLRNRSMNTLYFPSVIKAEFKWFEDEVVQHTDAPAGPWEVSDAPKGTLRYERDMAKEKGYDE